jgi:hypothetical protein
MALSHKNYLKTLVFLVALFGSNRQNQGVLTFFSQYII